MRLNLRQLEAFRAVFETNSMTAGSALMGITQQAASRLIRDLEAETGLSLFERQGRGLLATEEAFALYREVKRSYHGLDRIAAVAVEISRKRPGALRIAASAAAALYFLPNSIDEFQKEWPGALTSLNMLPSAEVISDIARQHSDVGLADVPSASPGVDIERLPGLTFVCVMPKAHPLQSKRVIKPKDLEHVPMMMISQVSHQQQRIMATFKSVGVTPNIIFEASNSGPIRERVALGAGVAVLDPLTAAAGRGEDITIRRFSPAIPYDLSLIYPASRPLNDRVKSFARRVREDLGVVRKA